MNDMNETWEDFLVGKPAKGRSRREVRRLKKLLRKYRFSAGLAVDVGNTCQTVPSITGSGGVFVASGPGTGTYIGVGVNMLNSDTFCNLRVCGLSFFTSGQLRIAVQDSDSDVSGNYTDPTSGLAQMPTSFSSGGVLILNSGSTGGGTFGAFVSGQAVLSGFDCFAAFQRQHQYVRAIILSGSSDFFAGALSVGFLSQNKTTGSGGGFTYSPGSGTVSV